MFLPNLTTNVMYEVKIRGATRSLFSPSKIYPGLFSESRKIFVALDCDRLSLSHVQSGSEIFSQDIELSAGVVAAMVCASFAILLLVLAFVLWRKYFQVRMIVCLLYSSSSVFQLLPYYYLQAAYYYLDDGPPTTPPLNQPAWDGGEPPTHNNMTVIVDDDSDFAESKNKEYGVNAKGMRKAFNGCISRLHTFE
jgi:receptor-type tyrosine-protein phosphatase gamma